MRYMRKWGYKEENLMQEKSKKQLYYAHVLLILMLFIGVFMPFIEINLFKYSIRISIFDAFFNPNSAVGDSIPEISVGISGMFFVIPVILFITAIGFKKSNNILWTIATVIFSFKNASAITMVLGGLSDYMKYINWGIGFYLVVISIYSLVIIGIIELLFSLKPVSDKIHNRNNVKCPHCGTFNSEINSHCTNCGKDLYSAPTAESVPKDKWICNSCKSENDISSRFCRNCGNGRY